MTIPGPLILASLASPLCPACGGRKKPNTALCRNCAGPLSTTQRDALTATNPEYAQAFAAAMTLLKVGEPRMPGGAP